MTSLLLSTILFTLAVGILLARNICKKLKRMTVNLNQNVPTGDVPWSGSKG